MRKLLMGAAMALTAMGVSASAAVADSSLEARDHVTAEVCGEMYVDYPSGGSPWGVAYEGGGCVVEGFEGRYRLEWSTGQVSPYDVTFDLAVGPDGSALAFNQTISSVWNPFYKPCTMGSQDHRKFSWPVEFTALGGGEFSAEIALTFVYGSAPSGLCGAKVHVPLDVTDLGGESGTGFVQNGSSYYADVITEAQAASENTFDLFEIEDEE